MGHASMPVNSVAKAIYMVQKEKEGRPIGEEIVRDEFLDWVSINSSALILPRGLLQDRSFILCLQRDSRPMLRMDIQT